jgi:hypothetical protein
MKTLKYLTDKQLIEYYNLFKKASKRAIDVKIHKMDTKFAYHVLRLVNNAEQILLERDLDLTRDREQLKSVRRGEWKQADIRKWFEEKESLLEKVYIESKLQHSPDEGQIKQLLMNCLEHHYGSLDKCVVNVDAASKCIDEIKRTIERYKI